MGGFRRTGSFAVHVLVRFFENKRERERSLVILDFFFDSHFVWRIRPESGALCSCVCVCVCVCVKAPFQLWNWKGRCARERYMAGRQISARFHRVLHTLEEAKKKIERKKEKKTVYDLCL